MGFLLTVGKSAWNTEQSVLGIENVEPKLKPSNSTSEVLTSQKEIVKQSSAAAIDASSAVLPDKHAAVNLKHWTIGIILGISTIVAICLCISLDHPTPKLCGGNPRVVKPSKHVEGFPGNPEDRPNLVGGGTGSRIGISFVCDLCYGILKLGIAAGMILQLLQTDLYGCAPELILIMGFFAVVWAGEAIGLILFTSLFGDDIHQGGRVSCHVVVPVFCLLLVHFGLLLAGTLYAYSTSQEALTCPIETFAEIVFTICWPAFLIDIAVITKATGIITRGEMNPYDALVYGG